MSSGEPDMEEPYAEEEMTDYLMLLHDMNYEMDYIYDYYYESTRKRQKQVVDSLIKNVDWDQIERSKAEIRRVYEWCWLFKGPRGDPEKFSSRREPPL